jgi:CMP-N-acetylneuraminic acid synthetase
MIYAFIPARAGSTRLIDKNFLILKNKRLFEWSMNTANESKEVNKIIFSSDSNKYIEYANSINLNKDLIIDKRSSENSTKNTKIYDYLKGDFLKNNKYLNEKDFILMLLPTQPFRKTDDVKKIIELGRATKQNVFSSRQYDFHVSFAFETLEGNSFKPLFSDSPILTGNTRSQDQALYFHPDGSFYFLSIKSLMDKTSNSIYNNAIPYESTSEFFIDIDNKNDYEIAKEIAKFFKP